MVFKAILLLMWISIEVLYKGIILLILTFLFFLLLNYSIKGFREYINHKRKKLCNFDRIDNRDERLIYINLEELDKLFKKYVGDFDNLTIEKSVKIQTKSIMGFPNRIFKIIGSQNETLALKTRIKKSPYAKFDALRNYFSDLDQLIEFNDEVLIKELKKIDSAKELIEELVGNFDETLTREIEEKAIEIERVFGLKENYLSELKKVKKNIYCMFTNVRFLIEFESGTKPQISISNRNITNLKFDLVEENFTKAGKSIFNKFKNEIRKSNVFCNVHLEKRKGEDLLILFPLIIY